MSLDSTTYVDGNYSAKVYSGPVTPTGCFGPQPGRQVGFTQFRQSITSNVNFTDLTDSPDGFSFWFKLQPYNNQSGMAGFGIRVFGAESLAELDYVIDPDPSLGTFVNNTGVHSLLFSGYRPSQWYHFSRNLRADWLNFGLSLRYPLSLIQFQGFVTQSGSTVKSETFWLDDVRAYVGPSDFTISANPQTLVLSAANSSANPPIVTLKSMTGLSVAFKLSIQTNPPSLKLMLGKSSTNTTTLTIPANAQNTTSLLPIITSSTPDGTYVVTVTGTSGSTTHIVTVTITVTGYPDFSLATFPRNPQTVPLNWHNVVTTVYVDSLFGFAGQVSLSASVNSTGLNAWIQCPYTGKPGSCSTLKVTSPGYNATWLVFNATAVGYYTITVTGTGNSLNHQVNVYVNATTSTIGDFTLEVTPDSVSGLIASNTTATVILTSRDNYAGPVYLTTNVSCTGCKDPLHGAFAPKASLTPATVYLAANETTTSTLNIQTSSLVQRGSYMVEVNAGGRFLYYTFNVSFALVPPDFTISTIPTALAVQAGSPGSITMTLTSLNGFNGTVSLTSNSPLASLEVGTVTLYRGGTSTSTLKIVTAIGTPPGNYAITITAVGPYQGLLPPAAHNATLQVTVTAPPQPLPTAKTTILGLDPPVFYTFTIALTATVLALVTVGLLARRKPLRIS